MTAIVSEAHAHGRKVAAHAFSDGEIRQGLKAGVDDFQHLRTQTPIYPPDIVEMIRDRVKSGPPLYWTITAGGNGQLNAAYLASNPEFLDDPANFVGLPQPIVDDVRKGDRRQDPRDGREVVDAPSRARRRSTRSSNGRWRRSASWVWRSCSARTSGAGERSPARRHGWRPISGSMSSGMDPMMVIRSMTLDAARMMGADRESGSISQGKFADVIAVRGDPLRNIDVLRDPRIVIKHGRRYK